MALTERNDDLRNERGTMGGDIAYFHAPLCDVTFAAAQVEILFRSNNVMHGLCLRRSRPIWRDC